MLQLERLTLQCGGDGSTLLQCLAQSGEFEDIALGNPVVVRWCGKFQR